MKMPEKFLHLLWNHLLFNTQNLKSSNQETIKILNKGKYNYGQGPDFQEALIEIDGIKWNGSIEIETNAQNWYYHQHHKNPQFNNVVLLVCYDDANEVKIINNNGWEIPILNLKPYFFQETLLKLEIILNHEIPCKSFINKYPLALQKSLLTQKAIERLEDKICNFKEYDMEIMSWRMLWKAFGDPYHSNLFLEISKTITPSLFFQNQNIEEKEALVFGVAGFFTGEEDCSYFSHIKSIWQYLKQKYSLNELNPQYCNFKTRFYSYPNILLAQIIGWLHFYGNKILNPQKEYFDDFGDVSSYWKKHIFWRKTSKTEIKIGKQKKYKLMLNWYFPFRWYYATRYAPQLCEKILDDFSKIIKEENNIIKKLEHWGWKIDNGLESQGGIQIYKKYCLEKRCLDCNLGQWIIKNN